MGNTQVTSLHPVLVPADPREPQIVKNAGGGGAAPTIYYRSQPFVSSATNDGNLTEGSEVTIYGNTWFVTKAVELASNKKEEPVDGEIHVEDASFTLASVGSLLKVSGASLEADITGPKLIYETPFEILESTAEGAGEPYIIADSGITGTAGNIGVLAAAKLVKYTEKVIPSHFVYTTSEFAVAGKKATASLVIDLINGKGAAPTMTFGLYQVTLSSETTKVTELTYGSAITGSATVFTTPAAKTIAQKITTGIALTGGASYSIGFIPGAAFLAESLIVGHAKVYISNA